VSQYRRPGGVGSRGRYRHSAAVYRRRRLGAAALLTAVAVAVAVAVSGGGGGHPQPGSSARPGRKVTGAVRAPAPPAGIPAVEAGLVPWTLPEAVSRMVVLPGSPGHVTVVGGLLANQSSTAAVYQLDTASGAATPAGTLAAGTHDAAGAVIGGRDWVFGGGSPTTVAADQVLTPGGGPAAADGHLPAPRSDQAAVTVGPTTYIAGGYDGSAPDGAVLATTDGVSFRPVANLPVPVRYPAVAALGGRIYLFGGETVGTGGAPTTAIQGVDPRTHRAVVVGHLPSPLEGASAFTLDGHIYVAGGDGPPPAATPEGAGTTQLDGWGMAAASGAAGPTPTGAIWAYDPATATTEAAGQLQVPVTHAGVAVSGGRAWLVGGENGADLLSTVQVLTPDRSFGTAGKAGAGSPYYGYQLLVADRGNNRLMLMNPSLAVAWRYPNPTSPADPYGFYFPDDAFFIDHGTAIISNQEQNETIIDIGYPSGRITWEYGHPKVSGTAAGYLYEPDDAYLLKDGQVTVADANNCRVLVINHNGTVAHQIGTDGTCVHNPPVSMGSPNGDTPLWDGNLLISEINGSWVSEYTPTGAHVWSVQLPIAYPSDPQQLGAGPTRNPDRYLIADYASPGQVLQFTRQGQILSRYDVASGPGRLDHPSLAEMLPSGVYLLNDDYNDRMVAIDPVTGALVWQYGVTGHAGTAPGQLNTPDGFDLLGPGGTTPTHPQTG
jgi:hypothetical protein